MQDAHADNEKRLFVFARAVKAFEITNEMKLSPKDITQAFSLWWNIAQQRSLLPDDADFDEWRFCFEDTFSKTKSPLGSHQLKEAMRRADANPPPAAAMKYSGPALRRLVSVCSQLQKLQGKEPFFLGVRDAAAISGSTGPHRGSVLLCGLVRDGVLTAVEKGTPGGRKATRYLFTGKL